MRSIAAIAVVPAAALALSACGSGASYKNEDRPPSPINVSVSISSKRVSVSPARFGAGPIVLVVTNQSSRSQDLTIETDQIGGSQAGIKQSTGPINPLDTAELKVNVTQGSYRVHVGGASVAPATVTVGRPRPTAQQKVLQP